MIIDETKGGISVISFPIIIPLTLPESSYEPSLLQYDALTSMPSLLIYPIIFQVGSSIRESRLSMTIRNYTLQGIYKYYKQNGPIQLFTRTIKDIKKISAGVIFGILNILVSSDKNKICFIPRGMAIDQDMISLIAQDSEYPDDVDIYLAVDLANLPESHLDMLYKSTKFNCKMTDIDRWGFLYTLSRCNTIIFKDYRYVWIYNWFDFTSKDYIRIPHGIPAKGYQAFKTSRKCSLKKYVWEKVGLRDRDQYIESVSSDFELYYKSSVTDKPTDQYETFGQPRFDRLRYLNDHPHDCIIPTESREILQKTNSNIRILYAPTHKAELSETTDLFPFEDFKLDDLYTYLDHNNIRIFIRLHPQLEKDTDIIERYVDNQYIYLANKDFSISSTEILPHYDALITDYSTIYLDYILTDNPIIFVKDKFEEYQNMRTFAFDYDQYWPGPKVNDFESFKTIVTKQVVEGDDEYAYERRFVRNTFHPDLDGGDTTLERILNSQD